MDDQRPSVQRVATPSGAHPRRPPAHQSVSLLHSAQVTSDASAAGSTQANPSSSPPSKHGAQKNSSGESSNAEYWFEKNNNNVNADSPSFVDNDPPFFLQHSSSEETPPDPRNQKPPPDAALAYRVGGIASSNVADSSSEDFRSVIDDLTIENKRLKKKLRRYEKLQTARLHEDKLFEIRIHGLPPGKKQELEEYLKKFTMDMEKSPNTATRTTSSGADGDSSHPSLRPQNTKSSHTSHLTDSAYVSMSASGLPSIAPPSSESVRKPSRWLTPHHQHHQRQQRQQSIQNYLQDIPLGLLPKQQAPMSDKSRKKLVVRRLEQIFAGKGAATGGHQHPEQQEEIAQLAARDDRSALEATGQRAKQEGHREARILQSKSNDPVEDAELVDTTDSSDHVEPKAQTNNLPPKLTSKALKKVEAQVLSDNGNKSPDQRPTRPLDLDPYRAQVPADNIEYIRHLGFSPMDPDANNSPIDGHGWIYLNVLTNMAQLHTINVTADFVRAAICDYSKKFELSKDGRKVRWRGGRNLTRNSSDSGSPEHPALAAGLGRRTGTKRPNPSQSTSDVSSENMKPENKLTYVPLFAHKIDSDEDMGDSSNEDSLQSSVPIERLGATSALNSAGMHGSSSKKRRSDDGPIIFYNRARFITDLSGNQKRPSYASEKSANYSALSTNPIGTSRADMAGGDMDAMDDVRGPLTNISPATSAEGDISSTPSDKDVTFLSDSTSSSRLGTEQNETMEFEASGIGGVHPKDNFAIDVRSRHVAVLGSEAAATFMAHPLLKSYPKKIREILRPNPGASSSTSNDRGSIPVQGFIGEEIISSHTRNLPASALPEASYLPFDSMDEDSDDDLDDSISETGVSSLSRPPPTTVPQLMAINTSSSDDDDDEDDDDDDDDDDENKDNEDDESVDFLATPTIYPPVARLQQLVVAADSTAPDRTL